MGNVTMLHRQGETTTLLIFSMDRIQLLINKRNLEQQTEKICITFLCEILESL